MPNFNEHALEMSIMELLQAEGYPDLEFEGERRKDLAFIGRARKVERDL